MGQLLKNFALKMSYAWNASDDNAHFITTLAIAICPLLLITLFVIIFKISLLKIMLILIIAFLINFFLIYLRKGPSSLAESKCISGGHTWIKVGEHNVSEPWSDKQFITYSVADFKCSVCGMKKEETVESIEKRNRINEEKKWSKW